MKKVLAFLICALLILSASACGSLEVKEDNNSVNSGSEYSEILINANVLCSISIHNVHDEELARISVKEDWAFLSKYTKSHTLTKEETNKLLVYPDNHIIYLNTISDEGEEVVFDKVLMVEGKIGNPLVEGAKVVAKVVAQGKAPKIIVYKYKSKKNYHKKQGHRQPFTKVQITKIEA